MRIIKSFRRSISIHIEEDGSAIVRAPKFMPDIFIEKFVGDHKPWIEKHSKLMQLRPKKRKRMFADGETFLFLGAEYTLKVGAYKTIETSGSHLLFPKHLEFRIQKELAAWYQHKAMEVIKRQVEEHEKIMGVTHSEIYFSDTRSKWGSCSHDDRLQFNWRLVMAPLLVLRYVVIHELVHTMEKNHSRAFWDKVAQYNPSYRQQVKWLKTHGHTLVI